MIDAEDEQSRRTMEKITDLICKYQPDIMNPYNGLSGFTEWFRSLNAKKLYKRLK